MNMQKRWERKMFLISVFVLCCSHSALAETKTNHANSGGQELIVALGSISAEGFDPMLGWGRYGTPLFQSTLLRRDADLNIVPDLAETYAPSKNGLCWKVKIRSDARFTDGTPVKAKDVAFTYNRAAKSSGKTDLTMLDKAVSQANMNWKSGSGNHKAHL